MSLGEEVLYSGPFQDRVVGEEVTEVVLEIM
jgi:hypothetical protein